MRCHAQPCGGHSRPEAVRASRAGRGARRRPRGRPRGRHWSRRPQAGSRPAAYCQHTLTREPCQPRLPEGATRCSTAGRARGSRTPGPRTPGVAPLAADAGLIALREPAERSERQRRRAAAGRQPPGAAYEAVDEQGALAEDPLPQLGGDDPGAVACETRMLSYSGRKRGGAGVAGSGRGACGRSNSSRPCSSRKRTSSGRRRSKTSPSRVSPHHVCASRDARRTEGPEVAEDQGVERRVGRDGNAEPRLGRGQGGHAAGAPDPARRQLHQRQQVAQSLRHRLAVAAGEARREQACELRIRAGLLLEQLATGGDQRLEVHAPRGLGPRGCR